MKDRRNGDSCVICNEINSISQHNNCAEYGTLIQSGNHILYKDDDFTVIPSIGALNEGHVLIVPNVHILGLCELDQEMIKKLNRLKQVIREYNLKYGKIFTEFFEHGTGHCYNSGGSCVAHAHMHVVTTNKSIHTGIPESVSFNSMKSSVEIINRSNESRGYLYFEDMNGLSWINDEDILPSQFMRMCFGKTIGNTDKWDWRSYPEYIKIISVCNYYSQLKEFAK